MCGRPWNPLRLLAVAIIALVVAVTLVGAAVVLAFVLAADPDGDDDTTTPAAPPDLCTVVGRDDLVTWVPGSDPSATVEGGQATCEATTPDGEGQLTARVFRYAPREDQPGSSGRTQAESAHERACTEAQEDDVGVGDESCLVHLSGGGSAASARVEVRQGADVLTVTYFGDPLTTEEARGRAVEAATRIAAELRRA